MRAAALAELELRGALVDDGGRATVPRMRRPDVTDPLLIEVLADTVFGWRQRRANRIRIAALTAASATAAARGLKKAVAAQEAAEAAAG